MQRAVECTLRLKEGGLMFAGLPCHSFIFLNLATSMRSQETPLGDESKLYVRQSNAYLSESIFIPLKIVFTIDIFKSCFIQQPRLAARLLILCCLAVVRKVHFAIEQPGTSTFVHFPYLKFVIQVLNGFVPIDVDRLLGAQLILLHDDAIQ